MQSPWEGGARGPKRTNARAVCDVLYVAHFHQLLDLLHKVDLQRVCEGNGWRALARAQGREQHAVNSTQSPF